MKAKRNQRSGKPSARQNKKKIPAAAETVVSAVESAAHSEEETTVSAEKEVVCPVAEEAAPAAVEAEVCPAVEVSAPATETASAPTPEVSAPTAEKAEAPVAPQDDAVFERRLARHQDELKWLYCELYHGDLAAYDYFVTMLRRSWADRKEELCAQDARREADPDWTAAGTCWA